jgi:tetratricopeptide (TPR) repeat protein
MNLPRRLAWLTALSLLPASFALPRPELVEAVARQRAMATEQPTAEAWSDLGNLLVDLGAWEEAREAYERALALEGSHSLPLYNLGLLEMELGDVEKAEARFEAALDIDPAFALAHYRLGDLHRARDRNRRAVEHYAEAFRLAPELSRTATNPDVLDNPLVTWALTLAYLDPVPGRRARTYGQPERIARLLVGDAVQPPVADPEAEPPVEPASQAPISNAPAADEFPPEDTEADEPPAQHP